MRHNTAWKLWYKKGPIFVSTASIGLHSSEYDLMQRTLWSVVLSCYFLRCFHDVSRRTHDGVFRWELSFAPVPVCQVVICTNLSLLKCRTNQHNSLAYCRLHSNVVFYSTCKCLTSALPVVLSGRPHTFYLALRPAGMIYSVISNLNLSLIVSCQSSFVFLWQPNITIIGWPLFSWACRTATTLRWKAKWFLYIVPLKDILDKQFHRKCASLPYPSIKLCACM